MPLSFPAPRFCTRWSVVFALLCTLFSQYSALTFSTSTRLVVHGIKAFIAAVTNHEQNCVVGKHPPQRLLDVVYVQYKQQWSWQSFLWYSDIYCCFCETETATLYFWGLVAWPLRLTAACWLVCGLRVSWISEHLGLELTTSSFTRPETHLVMVICLQCTATTSGPFRDDSTTSTIL